MCKWDGQNHHPRKRVLAGFEDHSVLKEFEIKIFGYCPRCQSDVLGVERKIDGARIYYEDLRKLADEKQYTADEIVKHIVLKENDRPFSELDCSMCKAIEKDRTKK